MTNELPEDINEISDDLLDDIEPVGDEAQLYEHFRVVVDKGQEMIRVDKYLFDRLTNASRNRIQKAAEAGFVMANGKPVKSSYKVKPLDVITVMMDRPRYENEVIPEGHTLGYRVRRPLPLSGKQACRAGGAPRTRQLPGYTGQCLGLGT